jgi:Flp pilus assembly pilin Flp
MRADITSVLRRLCRDESGTEVIEYAIVCGLVIVVAIAVIKSTGTKVLARWQTINSST